MLEPKTSFVLAEVMLQSTAWRNTKKKKILSSSCVVLPSDKTFCCQGHWAGQDCKKSAFCTLLSFSLWHVVFALLCLKCTVFKIKFTDLLWIYWKAICRGRTDQSEGSLTAWCGQQSTRQSGLCKAFRFFKALTLPRRSIWLASETLEARRSLLINATSLRSSPFVSFSICSLSSLGFNSTDGDLKNMLGLKCYWYTLR